MGYVVLWKLSRISIKVSGRYALKSLRGQTGKTMGTEKMGSFGSSTSRAIDHCNNIFESFARQLSMSLLHVRCFLFGNRVENSFPDV